VVASDFVLYALDRLLLINFNKESRMHLFDADARASPFQNNLFIMHLMLTTSVKHK
jgi:hypothetical protein